MGTLWIRYLEANLLLVVGFGCLQLLGAFRFRYSQLSKLSRLLLAASILLPFGALLFPKQSFLATSAQIWSAESMREKPSALTKKENISVGITANNFSLNRVFVFLLAAILCGFIFVGMRFWIGFRSLLRVFRESHPLKRIGKTEIRISDSVLVPFSFWIPGKAFAVLPSHLVENPEKFLIALRHELQHHRQGDTRWVFLLEILRGLFLLNPIAHLLAKRISEIQELACDEILVVERRLSPQVYGGCLIEVAETARHARALQVGTTCMAASQSGATLKRRIQMLVEKKRYLGRSVGFVAAGLSLVVMATAAWATQGLVQDRRVSLQEAKALARKTASGSFPITVNEAIVRELNLYVGTPDGREFVKNALRRLENHRALVQEKLDTYNLTVELMALPIIESGYENLSESPRPSHAAGIWQFIPQTARRYGLIVDEKTDERLNIEKETDAACRYLGALHLMFQDWELAVTAYNAGENRVYRGISETGSRNAWTLIEKGYGGDSGYLAKMIAAVLIMQSPSLVE